MIPCSLFTILRRRQNIYTRCMDRLQHSMGSVARSVSVSSAPGERDERRNRFAPELTERSSAALLRSRIPSSAVSNRLMNFFVRSPRELS